MLTRLVAMIVMLGVSADVHPTQRRPRKGSRRTVAMGVRG
jgi:hypothetical protein